MKRIDTNDAVSRYLAGESAKCIAESHGISSTPVVRQLRRAGVFKGNEGGQRRRFGTPEIDEAKAVDSYLSGESEKAVAMAFGCSRDTIRSILLKKNIAIRDRSDAMLLRMAKATPEERLALTDAAHAAIRGIPQSEETRLKMSKGRERNQSFISPAEDILAANLRAFGIRTVIQKSVGRYNIDIALTESSIAVEIFGGHWHGSGLHLQRYRQRTDYLIDRGWLPIIIWITPTFHLSEAAINYIVAWHERRCRGKSCGREEHVIRGDGEGGPISKGQPSCVPSIPCPKTGNDPRRNNLRTG